MTYVLVVITVFVMTGSVSSESRFQEFDSKAACETAKAGIGAWIDGLGGSLGRHFFVACYPKG
ncbi:MAG: hypothetical protein ACE5H8_11290 [Alphaproteobacteria bacterium]